ncbi:MAG TPA: amino acid transporter [Actinomycetota bacterium]|nr:amino acid transporter [Actinomycetota bacterium]
MTGELPLVAEDPENWDPILLNELPTLLRAAGKPWWIAGGVAIDMFLGRTTRPHRDVDIAVLRIDQLDFQRALAGWDLQVPVDWEGEPEKSKVLFRRWAPGEFLDRDVSQAWCRRTPSSPWSFELLYAHGNHETWKFKKDESIQLPLPAISSISTEGLPYLNPEIVLLHKSVSTYQAPTTEPDFEVTLPHLTPGQKIWLSEGLRRVSPDHPWLTRLEPA